MALICLVVETVEGEMFVHAQRFDSTVSPFPIVSIPHTALTITSKAVMLASPAILGEEKHLSFKLVMIRYY